MRSDTEIFYDADRLWGSSAQIQQTIEELSELIVELCHVLREEKGDLRKVEEEVVDVEFMLDQIKYIFGMDDSILRTIRIRKTNYLEDLINKERSKRTKNLEAFNDGSIRE